MTGQNYRRITLVFTLVLLLTGCGVDKNADVQEIRNDIQRLKSEACLSWTSGIVNDNNFQSEGSIIMSESAAQKFAQLAAIDPTYEYASKAAYTLTAFNGTNITNTAANLKPLILLAITDMKRACLN